MCILFIQLAISMSLTGADDRVQDRIATGSIMHIFAEDDCNITVNRDTRSLMATKSAYFWDGAL